MKMSKHQQVTPALNVEVPNGAYPIFIGSGILNQVDLSKFISGSKVLIVTDDVVGPIYLDKVQKILSRYATVDFMLIGNGEKSKNMDNLSLIHSKLIENHHDRSTTLVALGGGVIGDVAGFAAASYQRGINFIQLPTTLLAQVDSSVGGKTGINHALGKNMIGAFHQPRVVVIDLEFLETLPHRQFSAGVAEIIKYGLIENHEFYDWIIKNRSAIKQRQTAAVVEIIEMSCKIKAKIVAQDEKESNVRAILNFGHTFGHAIEAFQNYRGLLHGEAISIGMVLGMNASKMVGDITDEEISGLKDLFLYFDLPVTVPEDMLLEDFLSYAKRDKKVIDGNIRLILLKSIGEAFIEEKETLTLFNKIFQNA
tara:strand:+ start:717 stop:1817 length:1101 start_codon:yes stop_codon:yes gene_type:complete